METSLAERLFVVILTVVAVGSVMTLIYTLVITDPIHPPSVYLQP